MRAVAAAYDLSMADLAVPEPFTLSTDPAAVRDLRSRLRATRWPDAPEGLGWSQGVEVGQLRDLVEHWAEDFDWSAQEAALNQVPQSRYDEAKILFG